MAYRTEIHCHNSEGWTSEIQASTVSAPSGGRGRACPGPSQALVVGRRFCLHQIRAPWPRPSPPGGPLLRVCVHVCISPLRTQQSYWVRIHLMFTISPLRKPFLQMRPHSQVLEVRTLNSFLGKVTPPVSLRISCELHPDAPGRGGHPCTLLPSFGSFWDEEGGQGLGWGSSGRAAGRARVTRAALSVVV